jgi:hypothetical protein
MKKHLLMAIMAGLTVVVNTIQSAAASSNPQTTVTNPNPVSTTQLNTQITTQSQSATTTFIGQQIQAQTAGITTAVNQQASGITTGINNIPVVGNLLSPIVSQQLQQAETTGIAYLTKTAMAGVGDFMTSSGLSSMLGNIGGGISQLIGGLFGGGNSAQNAQQQAQSKTVADYQQGVTDAATEMSKASQDQLDATERLLQTNAGQTGDVGKTTAYVSGAKQAAEAMLKTNPASGNLTDKSAVDVKATQAIAESANGVAGQAALSSRVVNTAVNVAGMQSDANKTVDNSLDQLNIISGQLAKQGDINGEAVRIAAEQRTIAAAQLAQNGSDADARVRQEREEQRQKDYLLVNRTYNRGVIAGLTGAVKAGGKLP